MYFKIFGCLAVVEKVSAGAFDDEFPVFDAEGVGVFAGFPVFQVFAVKEVGPLGVGAEAREK